MPTMVSMASQFHPIVKLRGLVSSILSSARRQGLRDARRLHDNPRVITGPLPGKPLNDLQPFWQRARRLEGRAHP